MSVSSVNHDCINTRCHKSINTLHTICRNTHTGCHTQTSERILACVRFVFSLSNVLVCHKSDKFTIGIYHGKFFNFVLLEDLSRLFQIRRLICGDKVILCHHIINEFVEVTLKTQVTICDYSHKVFGIINHRNTTDMVFFHHLQSIGNSAAAFDSDRVVNHTVFSTFHGMNLASLLCDGHVFVNNTDTAFTCYRNSKLLLRNSVHSGRHDRNIKTDVSGKLCFERYLRW